MRKRCLWCPAALLFAAAVLTLPRLAGKESASSSANDWPQWQGPQRDAISPEKGLLQKWPADGPPQLWKAELLGQGYSAPSVAGGRVYEMGLIDGIDYVWALDEATGKEVWKKPLGRPNIQIRSNGVGPRCTPTVDGDRLYALTEGADLVCMDTGTGKILWHKNLRDDFGGRLMSGWGYSESPLVDGDKLLCTPGGSEATIVALNKKNGEAIWKSAIPNAGGAGYASMIKADVDGLTQYIQFLGRGVVGVAARDGKFLWRYDKVANGVANTTTPVFHDNCVFATSAYGKGAALIRLTRQGDGIQAREVYFTRRMKNHHGGVVLVDGYIYGSTGGNGERPFLLCMDFKTGKVQWEHREKGSVSYADGCIYFRDENGPMVLVRAGPKEYVELGRFQQPDRSRMRAWSHPVIANGKLFLRDQDVLLCYDVKKH